MSSGSSPFDSAATGVPTAKPQGSLNARELALIDEIRSRSRANSTGKVRTGRVSMSELMGGGDKENVDGENWKKGTECTVGSHGEQRPHSCEPAVGGSSTHPSGFSVDPATLLDVAGWKIPPLPPGLVSITHDADHGHYPSSLPPCIFEKAMKAAAIVQAGSQPQQQSQSSKTDGPSVMPGLAGLPMPPADLLRLLPPLSPMFPLVQGEMRPPLGVLAPGRNPFHQGSASGQAPGGRNGVSYGSGHQQFTGGGHGNVQQRNAQQSQKTRKPYFMPYMSVEAVTRGLANGDLVKGSLRVNQRNYEESFVDNPAGDDQQDILILGVHDRNRALHGDIVVVRVKDRINWIVRDALYDAWRSGHLKVECDDDGKPITVPPIKREDKKDEPSPAELLDLPVCVEKCVSSEQLKEKVPVPKNRKYTREQMLCIAAQMELGRRKKGGVDELNSFNSAIKETIGKLAITKRVDCSTSGSPQSKNHNCMGSNPAAATGILTSRRPTTAGGNAPQRRLNYRTLSDMADEDWGMPDICLQKTAEVVFICEAKNCRAAVGVLKMMADGNRNWALFSPGDSRMPRMMIPAEQLPTGFFDRPQDFAKYIFIARMVEWQATAQFARGKLYKSLGLAGDIDAETEGLLLASDVDTREFSVSVLSCLPISEAVKWKIDEKEFKYRRDFRDETTFTIDPVTARDMDDALHIKPIDDCDGAGNPGWEVGVHIADVSYFVHQGTELDQWAYLRGTSVYLVHKVIPMLPRILCEELCSLNPGVDRLTFSVVWKMNEKAEIFDEWFGRSMIRSCCKMSYEHAQDFIKNPDKDFDVSELPEIFNDRKPPEIKEAVLNLHKFAKILRGKRCDNGSLWLDQPKLCFSLDEESGLPNGVCIYERNDAHLLVEEFMLLANMAVARKIEAAYPKTALLRRHPPPKGKVLREILEQCKRIGFPVDGQTSATISSSLRKFEGDSELKRTIVQVLSHLLMKSMQLAVYFCTGSMKSQADYRHYALSVPFYTHFTSPIRRYPDIMVHRLLSAALKYTPAPALTIKEIESMASHCNDKKLNAKAVSEASDDMFFGIFVKECGPITERAVVLQVLDASFDVLVIKYGVVKRVYANRLRTAREPRFVEGPLPTLTLFWDPHGDESNAVIEQTIRVCSIIDVVLSALPEPTKYQATIKQPNTEEKMISLAEAFAATQ